MGFGEINRSPVRCPPPRLRKLPKIRRNLVTQAETPQNTIITTTTNSNTAAPANIMPKRWYYSVRPHPGAREPLPLPPPRSLTSSTWGLYVWVLWKSQLNFSDSLTSHIRGALTWSIEATRCTYLEADSSARASCESSFLNCGGGRTDGRTGSEGNGDKAATTTATTTYAARRDPGIKKKGRHERGRQQRQCQIRKEGETRQ